MQSFRLLFKLFLLFAALITSSKAEFLTLLIKIFKYRATNMREFSLTINIRHIYYFIIYYKSYIKSYLTIINSICYYYGYFIWFLLLTIILKSNFIIIIALNNHIINLTYFNYCGQKIDKYCFCLSCYYPIKQKKAPKFFFLNKGNILTCQDYFLILEIFTLVKEIFIAQCYLVILILKL